MKGVWSVLLLLIVSVQLHAQDLYIKVLDLESYEPLSGARVYFDIDGLKSLSLSSDNGIAATTNVKFPLTIRVATMSYKEQIIELDSSSLKRRGGQWHYTVKMQKIDYSLNEVVITGRMKPELEKNSIFKVKTISKTEIQKRGAVSLDEVLRFELNQYIQQDNILGTQLNSSALGGQNIKLLLNGVPITGTEGGFIDLTQINMNNVKRIELIQGPMSVMYGSNAMAGVINIITKESKQDFDGSLKAYAESIGRTSAAMDLGVRHKKHSARISLAQNFFNGWDPSDTFSRNILLKPKMQYAADLNYTYKLNKGQLNFYSNLLHDNIENKGVPVISPYKAYAFDTYFKNVRWRNSVNFNYELDDETSVSFQNSLISYNRYKSTFRKNLVSLEQAKTNGLGDQDRSKFQTLHLRGVVNTTKFKNSDVIVGYETSYETARSYKINDGLQDMLEVGVFSSWSYGKNKWSIMPAIRLNMHSTFATNANYGLHAKYDISDNMQTRASITKSYRAPSMKELYLDLEDNTHSLYGNSSLSPENGYHAQFTIEKRVSLEKGELFVETASMYNDIYNRISLVSLEGPGILAQYQNLERFTNNINSFKVRFKNKALESSLAYSHTSLIRSSGLPSTGIHEFTSHLSYLIPKAEVRFNTYYKYSSSQPILFIDGSYGFTRALHMLDLSASRAFIRNSFNIQLGVKNLANIQNNLIGDNSGAGVSAHGGENTLTIGLPRSGYIQALYKF